MNRTICPRCGFPQSVCLCAAIRPMTSRHRLIILQHPSEAAHAKNSARLIPLCLPDTRIWPGESEADFAELIAQLAADPRPAYLLYPAEPAQAVEPLSAQGRFPRSNLILLDGTWRKAYRTYQLNPWLQKLPKLTFAAPPPSRYQIRKARQPGSLSTLEAAAWCLHHLEKIDVSPLLELFHARINGQISRMPDTVQARYQGAEQPDPAKPNK